MIENKIRNIEMTGFVLVITINITTCIPPIKLSFITDVTMTYTSTSMTFLSLHVIDALIEMALCDVAIWSV